MWPPCLEGPDRNEDTMDEAGRNEPARMRLVGSFKPCRPPEYRGEQFPTGPWGTPALTVQLCD